MTTTHIPKPGDRVRIEEILSCDRGKPEFEALVGKVFLVREVIPPEGKFALMIGVEGFGEKIYCRVSPLPASELEVECSHLDCGGSTGGECCRCCECSGLSGYGERQRFHHERRALFLSLTGQAPKDSATGPVMQTGTAPALQPREASPSPSGGDSGTGRAAGAEGRKDPLLAGEPAFPQPAAPSGFPTPKDVYDVECETCGAKHRVLCFTRVADGGGMFRQVEPHALRVRAFEARREKPERSKVPPRRPIPILAADTRSALDAEHIRKLRHDLDRPLPKVVAAERIWPAGVGECRE